MEAGLRLFGQIHSAVDFLHALNYNIWTSRMTIAEKVYDLEVGGVCPSPPTVHGLIKILKTDNVFNELFALFPLGGVA